ncbi:MAG: inositol monophosphatase [Chloroflexi bacterium]|nr:inositol monophosphatase [Chloroflexota bacterium]
MPTPSLALFAQGLALQVGRRLARRFEVARNNPRRKADRSLVTDADLEADEAFTRALEAAFPGVPVLSEERTTILPETTTAWVLDPLDGTTNFALGLPLWGVLLAFVEDGQPTVGVAYFPVMDELFVAVRGQGATRNGAAIHTRGVDTAHETAFALVCSRSLRRYRLAWPWKMRILGSAGYEWTTVARGVAVASLQATPKVWDLAAPALVLTEAGGHWDVLQGENPFPLKAGVDYKNRDFPALAAASPELWQTLREGISPRAAG